MKRSVFIIFGLLLINILFVSADPCETSDGVTCCYGTCNWGLPGPDSTDGSCGGQCQNWGCVACAPSCSPSCACATNTCTGQSCDDGCGGSCPGTKCCSTCGDSLIQCSETCDDGNTQSGDGCSNVCAIEPGYQFCNDSCSDQIIPLWVQNTPVASETTNICPHELDAYWPETHKKLFMDSENGIECLTDALTSFEFLGLCFNSILDKYELTNVPRNWFTTSLNCQNKGAGWDLVYVTPSNFNELTQLKQCSLGYKCLNEICVPNTCTTNKCLCESCGDFNVTGFEECDDGNLVNGDGCSDICLIEDYDDDMCGDGILFNGSEECDDGNLINFDGCSSTCDNETYDNSYCGDGILFLANESCDDGNLIDFDGCSSTCNNETYDNSYCGDGIWFKGYEECDDNNLINGDGCSSTCVLQPEAYFLDSNGLRITKAHIGETVKLVLNNTGILNGSFSFEIFEDDPAFDDEIRTGINAISGTFKSVGWGIIIGEWTITEQDYSITEIGDYDDFYFKINGYESNRLEILVQDVTPWCSNYETEVSCNECDYISCNAAENSVNEKVFEAFPEIWNDTRCGDEIAGPDPSCSYLMLCKCIWNSSTNKCDYTWDSSPGLDCDTDSPTVGSCKYSESTVDNCNDGFLEYSWSTVWTWGADNGYATYSNGPSNEIADYVLENGLYYYDPFKLSPRCVGGSNIIPCPAKIQLPFFGVYNLIITISLIAGIYFVLRRN